MFLIIMYFLYFDIAEIQKDAFLHPFVPRKLNGSILLPSLYCWNKLSRARAECDDMSKGCLYFMIFFYGYEYFLIM